MLNKLGNFKECILPVVVIRILKCLNENQTTKSCYSYWYCVCFVWHFKWYIFIFWNVWRPSQYTKWSANLGNDRCYVQMYRNKTGIPILHVVSPRTYSRWILQARGRWCSPEILQQARNVNTVGAESSFDPQMIRCDAYVHISIRV